MEKKQMAVAIDGIADEIRRTAGVSEPDVFRRCIYGDIARLACRDLPRLSATLTGKSSEDASVVLRDVGASVEANRSIFAWVAPTLSKEAQSIMKTGGGDLVGAAMSMVAMQENIIRDDVLCPKPSLESQVMFAHARKAIASGRGGF